MKLADAEILILPGLGNSGPGHWQHRWAERFKGGRIVEHGPASQIFGSPRSDRTREFLQRALGEGNRPRTVVSTPPLAFNQLRFAL